MTRLAGTSLVAMATAILLASLSLVAWRQARALEALEGGDGLQRELTLGEAEKLDLERQIDFLGSFGRVVPEARERLGMHIAGAGEAIILTGETT
jgi:hypothetical protein